MSATPTAMPTVTSNGPSRSPGEIVQSLSPEDKHDVFVALLKELLGRVSGAGLIPFEDADGQFLGYYVPPAAAKELADKAWAEMPAAVREHLGRPIKNLDDCVTADELLARLTPAALSTPP